MGRLDDEGEALSLQSAELRRQLATNGHLSEDERLALAARLEGLEARLRAARAAAAGRAARGRGGR